jgi:homoserine O-acetyltransferase/O-succinyltransferase
MIWPLENNLALALYLYRDSLFSNQNPWEGNMLGARITAMAAGAFMVMTSAMAQQAINYPVPKDGTYGVKDFKFSTGETFPELKIAYKTIGDPANPPVLILHGTGGSSANMLTPGFAGEMFGAGQPLDATKHFIIIPDALGTGGTTKPSNGLRAKFPKYNYDDMVDAQYRLVTEGLNIKRLRLVMGNSMGGMHTWVWGIRYPDMMDALAPMASQPTEMSSRNWMMRRLMIETIKADPEYMDGNYTTQPKMLRIANVFYATGTNGGDLAYQRMAPSREAADKLVDARLLAAPPADANDFLYQWTSSGDYNPAPKLPLIKAHLLAINSADDERNPVATGLMMEAMKSVKNGKLFLIPASPTTGGHGTTGGMAKLYAPALAEFMATVPKTQ